MMSMLLGFIGGMIAFFFILMVIFIKDKLEERNWRKRTGGRLS